jgi:hypothetical protein
MTVLPDTLLWRRTDTAGSEHVVLADGSGLTARGVQTAADPVPYTCRYELYTDASWATVRLEATVEGGGWMRTLRLERAVGRWRATTAEQGDLDAALRAAGRAAAPLPGSEDPDELHAVLDVDLAASPLTNTLPLRRLGLRAPGDAATVTAAWVLLPSLAVVAAEQRYEVLAAGLVRYSSGTFSAELEVDDAGYVRRYPGLAEAARPAR